MKSWLIYLWIVPLVKYIYTTPTWENCVAEARRLNRTISYSGVTMDTINEEEEYYVPRLDVDGVDLHPRTKRFIFPMMDDNRPRVTTDEVANLSLCPWNFQRDTNYTRIPSILYKAVCINNDGNNGCLLPDVGPSNIITALSQRIECAPVHSSVEVAYECCEEGFYSLTKAWVEWPVACTCARRRIRVVNATRK